MKNIVELQSDLIGTLAETLKEVQEIVFELKQKSRPSVGLDRLDNKIEARIERVNKKIALINRAYGTKIINTI